MQAQQGGLHTCTASTTMWAKKSDSESTILEDIAVFAALSKVSLPRLAVSMERCSSMYLQACAHQLTVSQIQGLSSILKENHIEWRYDHKDAVNGADLSHGYSVAANDRCWMDLVSNKLVGSFEQFSSDNDH